MMSPISTKLVWVGPVLIKPPYFLKNELESLFFKKPVIVFGDSEIDINLAKSYDFDFVFLSDWTVMKDWKNVCKNQGIHTINNLDSLTY